MRSVSPHKWENSALTSGEGGLEKEYLLDLRWPSLRYFNCRQICYITHVNAILGKANVILHKLNVMLIHVLTQCAFFSGFTK